MNKCMFIGNATRDVEIQSTASGLQFVRFSIAVNRGEEVDFISIVCWNKLAENCAKFVKKGNKVAIVGKLQIRTYTGKDGKEKTSAEIIADEVEFLSAKNQDSTQKTKEEQPIDDENLPF